MKTYALFFLCFFLACTSGKQTMQTKTDIEAVVVEKLGNTYESKNNDDESYSLYVQKRINTSQSPTPLVKYLVFDNSSSNIVYESSIRGSVAWYDNGNLSLFSPPGYFQQDKDNDDYTKILNLKSRDIIPKKEYLKFKKE